MSEVNIYIAATARGPATRRKAYYIYILEYKSEERLYTKTGRGTLEDVTENQITLTALVDAFKRFTEPCNICVYTECKHVINSMLQAWPIQWQKNGWVKPKTGKPVQNKNLWQQLLAVSKKHSISWTDVDHSYRSWMNDELNRMKEADRG